MDNKDGMNWAPTSGELKPVVKPGEFVFASAFLDHGHIVGQMNGLTEAGATCKWVWDPDKKRVDEFIQRFPTVKAAQSYEQILEDEEVRLVNAAAVPSLRAEIGFRALKAGKDYFTDKSPFTTLAQLEEARQVVRNTGKKYMCYYAERVHNEASWYAGELIRQGAIGDVVQVLILAPHSLRKESRPGWFFDKEKYGGILTDIGSHQFEQFLNYTGAKDATIHYARVHNFTVPDKPGLEDFGEASLTADTGASCYCRVDWLNPEGLRTWGDGRTFVLGTQGTLEVRKYIDIAHEPMESRLIYLSDAQGEQRIRCAHAVGFPFFGKLVLDCINRTENAMTQDHCFKAAELSMQAQAIADASQAG